MTVKAIRRVFVTAATLMAVVTATAACGSPQETATGGGDTNTAPVKVGIVHSQTGALASYGKQYIDGFRAGLAFATNGTNKVGERSIEVTEGRRRR